MLKVNQFKFTSFLILFPTHFQILSALFTAIFFATISFLGHFFQCFFCLVYRFGIGLGEICDEWMDVYEWMFVLDRRSFRLDAEFVCTAIWQRLASFLFLLNERVLHLFWRIWFIETQTRALLRDWFEMPTHQNISLMIWPCVRSHEKVNHYRGVRLIASPGTYGVTHRKRVQVWVSLDITITRLEDEWVMSFKSPFSFDPLDWGPKNLNANTMYFTKRKQSWRTRGSHHGVIFGQVFWSAKSWTKRVQFH